MQTNTSPTCSSLSQAGSSTRLRLSRRLQSKLLIELKRVYPQELPALIQSLPTAKLRNWCNQILEYELESESDDEVPAQPKLRTAVSNNKAVKPVDEKLAETGPASVANTETKSTSRQTSYQAQDKASEQSVDSVAPSNPQPPKSKPFAVKETPK